MGEIPWLLEDAVPMPYDDLLRCQFFFLSEANVQRLKCVDMALTVILSISPRAARPTHGHETIFFVLRHTCIFYFIQFFFYAQSYTG